MKTETHDHHTKLTKFLCQELLYEYVSKTLDDARKADVDQFLETCHESQRELLNLKKGIEYAQVLSSIRVSKAMQEALIEFEPTWRRRLRQWSVWSSRRGWKTIPYMFVVVAAGLTLAVWKPWRHSKSEVILISENPMTSPLSAHDDSKPLPASAQPPAAAANEPATPPASLRAPLLPAPAPAILPVPQKTPIPIAGRDRLPAPSPAPEPSGKSTSLQAKAAEVAADDQKHTAKAAMKGSLTRGELSVSDFSMTWPVIRDKIVSLGGKAAGSVELGWLRRKDQSYFHFSLPESNYAELQEFLKTFGPVQFHTEPHPRVMPHGQIRIILTIKDGETHEGSAEAP